jgi:hypothetical protein
VTPFDLDSPALRTGLLSIVPPGHADNADNADNADSADNADNA